MFGRATAYFSYAARVFSSKVNYAAFSPRKYTGVLLAGTVATIAISTTQYNSVASCDDKPVLIYFNGRGRAELARLLLAEAGIEWTDKRVAGPEFGALKDTLPYGQVPILEVNGEVIGQSIAISRYIARRYGFYGSTPEEGAKADMLVDGVSDLGNAFYIATDEEKKAKFWNEAFPKWAKYTERILTKNNEVTKSGFFVGKELTYADVFIFQILDGFVLPANATALDSFPLLKAHYQQIKERPKIAEWLKKRPVTAN